MNSLIQMFKTIAMFFGLIQKGISAVDHCVSMADETAELAHTKLTLNNGDELADLKAELAANKAARRVPAKRTPKAPK